MISKIVEYDGEVNTLDGDVIRGFIHHHMAQPETTVIVCKKMIMFVRLKFEQSSHNLRFIPYEL